MYIEWNRILKLKDNGNYDWVDYKYTPKWYYVYRKLAKLLSNFRGYNILVDDPINSNSKGNLLYRELISNKDFIEDNNWIKKFDSEWKVQSLDPIHIFASLNNNKLGYEKRLKRINILFKILDDNFKENYNDINFNGCPAPNTTKIISARDDETQKEVWSYFEDIITKSQNANLDFSKIQDWYGIDTSAFTIFLFWIDARNFLPLDKNTESLLKSSIKDFIFPNTYEDYKKLLIKQNTNLYILLSLISVKYKKLDALNKEEQSKISNFLQSNMTDSNIMPLNNFRLIAIKPLVECNKKYLKTLKKNEYYIFDKAYTIQDDIIKIDKGKNISLFDTKDLKININAIVGKNGTGKSTIIELLFAFIHNISLEKGILKNSEKIEDSNVELIYESNYLYKIIFNKNEF
jgi:ABC-type multidrug transport system fused ATPase/permease subunit